MVTFSQIDNIKRAGRLGNNLFQIAACAGIAKHYNDIWRIPPWRYSKFFPEVEKHVSDAPLKPEFVLEEKRDYRYIDNLPVYYCDNLTFDLHGYFQSYKYLERSDAMELFRSPMIGDKMDDGFVAVHVRRGDYLSRQICHPVQTVEYYEEAKARFPGATFFVFSDDIPWCKDNDMGDWYGSPAGSDIADFVTMCRYRHFIIANSSFSWWAAWLSGSNSVIAPKRWSGVTDDLSDLIPSEWRLI